MPAALVVLIGTYVVLRLVGVADSSAAFWAPTAAGLTAVWFLWRASRNSEEPVPQPVPRAKLARRVLTLVVLTLLSGSVVRGHVRDFVPEIPPGGSPDRAIAVDLRLSTTVALPITLIFVFYVGRLSATWLPVSRPFRWLAVISVISLLVKLALYPLAVTVSRHGGGAPPGDLAEVIPRGLAVTVLVFCALAFGNLSARKSAAQPAPAEEAS